MKLTGSTNFVLKTAFDDTITMVRFDTQQNGRFRILPFIWYYSSLFSVKIILQMRCLLLLVYDNGDYFQIYAQFASEYYVAKEFATLRPEFQFPHYP